MTFQVVRNNMFALDFLAHCSAVPLIEIRGLDFMAIWVAYGVILVVTLGAFLSSILWSFWGTILVFKAFLTQQALVQKVL